LLYRDIKVSGIENNNGFNDDESNAKAGEKSIVD
jgi:hypothetical protein